MTNDIKNLLSIARLCGFLVIFGYSAISQAESGNNEQYYEDLIANLPTHAAATKAVAQTLIHYELYRAYRLAEQQHCHTGWVLMGTLINKNGPDKPEAFSASTSEPAWSFTSRRKLSNWTCTVDPTVYLKSVRSHLPEWISLRYLTATEMDITQSLASLQ
jgi:hypothetical protein